MQVLRLPVRWAYPVKAVRDRDMTATAILFIRGVSCWTDRRLARVVVDKVRVFLLRDCYHKEIYGQHRAMKAGARNYSRFGRGESSVFRCDYQRPEGPCFHRAPLAR